MRPDFHFTRFINTNKSKKTINLQQPELQLDLFQCTISKQVVRIDKTNKQV